MNNSACAQEDGSTVTKMRNRDPSGNPQCCYQSGSNPKQTGVQLDPRGPCGLQAPDCRAEENR